jgi:hypothetical protein
MIVVHIAKVSALYPRVVISSLRGRLENFLFTILYTSFGVWPRDHYMRLQRFTMDRMPGLAKVVHGTIAMLRFPGVVRDTTASPAPCGPERMTMCHTQFLWQNQVLIVWPKVFTDNQMSRIKYTYYISNVCKD